ncbi:MAG: glycoside hydrolase family 18 protein [Bacteroidales bacterium]
MKVKITYRLFLLILLPLCALKVFPQPQKEIVGYYPNWQWYDRNKLVNPETIFYEKYTVINYAFFRPMADGTITSTDSWADENLLLGPIIWWPVIYHDSTKSLPYLAKQAEVKLLPSIGGWNDSYNFPGIATNAVKRKTFVNACVNLINTYNFDGVDLDWEYPGYAPNGGTPQDKQNFTLLVQELRNSLDSLEAAHNKDYLLTSCFGAAQSHMSNIEWASVLPLIDMVNLMTYDFHGSWDPESNFNTPLYPPLVGDPDWCVDGAFTLLTQTYGVPPEKVNIGVAFYGKSYANCTQLYGPHTGYDGVTFWEDEGQPLYYNILNKMDLFTRTWDNLVKCPYLLGNSINTFVSYDDGESLMHKAQYVMDNNAKGVIIWEITGDYIETAPGSGIIAGTPLLDTLNAVFSGQIQLHAGLQLKAFLEGPFNGAGMNTTLNSILPMNHPFNPALPYFGNPSPVWLFDGDGAVSEIPSESIVDWMLVELRDAGTATAATSATTVAKMPAFILADGTIKSLDGISDLTFSQTITENLFVAIHHRNHISIMSSVPATLSNGSYTYDFTTSALQVHGGVAGTKQLATGVWGMRSGDGNGDGAVSVADKTDVWSAPLQAGKAGYLPSDFNLDGQTNNKDKNSQWKPNIGTSSLVPE